MSSPAIRLLGKAGSSIFHGASGRTAGFAALEWSGVRDFTLLIYGGLMFIGGSTASVAGGIKVNTAGGAAGRGAFRGSAGSPGPKYSGVRSARPWLPGHS